MMVCGEYGTTEKLVTYPEVLLSCRCGAEQRADTGKSEGRRLQELACMIMVALLVSLRTAL